MAMLNFQRVNNGFTNGLLMDDKWIYSWELSMTLMGIIRLISF